MGLSAEQKKAIGKRVRELRGFESSQEEFAKKLEVTQTVLSRIENGKTEPGIDFLLKLSDVTGTTVDSILKD